MRAPMEPAKPLPTKKSERRADEATLKEFFAAHKSPITKKQWWRLTRHQRRGGWLGMELPDALQELAVYRAECKRASGDPLERGRHLWWPTPERPDPTQVLLAVGRRTARRLRRYHRLEGVLGREPTAEDLGISQKQFDQLRFLMAL